jgi:O-methyltransferase
MGLTSFAKTLIKEAIAPWRYQQPVPELGIQRLYLYLDALYGTRQLPGAVVEVGCFLGATAAYASRFLSGIGAERRYMCIDTFGGFPPAQFGADVEHGTDPSLKSDFSANSERLVRKLLNQWGCSKIELLQADIVELSADQLPQQIAVALIDVDIAEPTKAALQKIMPRMVPGGVILVDDCDHARFRGARLATEEEAPNARYDLGMAIITID